MAARFTIEIVGLQEVKQRFSPAYFRQALIESLPSAFEPARAAVQANAPHGKTLRLARRITVKVRQSRVGPVSVTIQSGAGYGHLVESGHRMVLGGRVNRARTLGSRVAQSLQGQRFTGRVVGFVPPHPFAAPAFLATQDQVSSILGRELAARLGVP